MAKIIAKILEYFRADRNAALAKAVGQVSAGHWESLCTAIILFSMAGGYLADRFSKSAACDRHESIRDLRDDFAMYAFWNGNPRMAFAVIFLASQQALSLVQQNTDCFRKFYRRIAVLGNGISNSPLSWPIIAGAVVGPILAQSFHGRAAIAGF